jgi:hypothetical protein
MKTEIFLFVILWAVILPLLVGCASEPAAEPFKANWEFVDETGKPRKACILEEDVQKLREQLIRCKNGD